MLIYITIHYNYELLEKESRTKENVIMCSHPEWYCTILLTVSQKRCSRAETIPVWYLPLGIALEARVITGLRKMLDNLVKTMSISSYESCWSGQNLHLKSL